MALRARLESGFERRNREDDRAVQLASALDELSDPVCVTSLSGGLVLANRAFHRLVGLGPLDPVAHLSLDTLLCVDADDGPLSALFGQLGADHSARPCRGAAGFKQWSRTSSF